MFIGILIGNRSLDGFVVAQIETLSSGAMLPLDRGEKNERGEESSSSAVYI